MLEFHRRQTRSSDSVALFPHKEFQLLVAPRLTSYQPPAALAGKIHAISVSPGDQRLSSTAVRLEISRGSGWRMWVPEEIAPLIERHYS